MYKYFAFISYSSKDVEWGKRVQKKLEGYRMPSTLCSQHGWPRTPMRPIFFAPTDIQPGELTVELQERMKASRHLIVICSPNSAQSKWVGKEISYFHSLGRAQNIHFFIIDGRHSGTEKTKCFNPVVAELGLSGVLGVNIHEKVSRWPWINKERAYVQLITKLLGVEFDSIWQRHKRMFIQQVILWMIGIMAIFAITLFVAKHYTPFSSQIQLYEASERSENLPDPTAIYLSMTLDNEIKHDTLCCSFDTPSTIVNIPHRFLNEKVKIHIECKDYVSVDTLIECKEHISIPIYRDPKPYGSINVRLWNIRDEVNVPFARIVLNNKFEFVSDSEGRIQGQIPLKDQRTSYFISSDMIEIEGIGDEGPILYMPNTISTILLVK